MQAVRTSTAAADWQESGSQATSFEQDVRVALCPHLSLEHYRGGEKWTAMLANRLAADGVDVAVHSLPYAPDGDRRVSASSVLDDSISYEESWRHDLSAYDASYIFYNPFSRAFFHGDTYRIAGIHSWAYITDDLIESHYGAIPTAVKALYRAFGGRELRDFDAVHTCTDAFDSPHPDTRHIPNYIDTDRYHPDAAPTEDEFTVLVTAAHIPEKGWDTVKDVAAGLAQTNVRVVTTGDLDEDPAGIESLGFLSEDELATWYARTHAVLHPTRVDADSIVMKEAWAAGTPVVTTPIKTHRTHQDTSAVLLGDSPATLLREIQRLRREWLNDDGYDDRAKTARDIGERYDADVVYPRLRTMLTDPRGSETDT